MSNLNVKMYNKSISKNIYLRLVDTINGVDLICVDEEGDAIRCGRILTVGNSGQVHLNEGLSSELGFKLDNDGKIMIN